MVRITTRLRFGDPLWLAQCRGCGFGCDDELSTKADAGAEARRLIRAELARQALEMRAHSAVVSSTTGPSNALYLHNALGMVMKDYEVLGNSPLRLPGEGA